MIKQTIKFTDFLGEERTSEEWFNLNKRELISLAAKYAPKSANLEEISKTIAGSGNLSRQLTFINDVILTSYGVRDTDGIVFKKSEQIRQDFENSSVYDAFFDLLLTNEKVMNEFVTGIPQDQAKKKSLAEAPVAK